MVESTVSAPPPVDEKRSALDNYRKKLIECRDLEQRLKELRKKVGLKKSWNIK